jgi:hypothetical protein
MRNKYSQVKSVKFAVKTTGLDCAEFKNEFMFRNDTVPVASSGIYGTHNHDVVDGAGGRGIEMAGYRKSIKIAFDGP